jgi:hypothetical protein
VKFSEPERELKPMPKPEPETFAQMGIAVIMVDGITVRDVDGDVMICDGVDELLRLLLLLPAVILPPH